MLNVLVEPELGDEFENTLMHFLQRIPFIQGLQMK